MTLKSGWCLDGQHEDACRAKHCNCPCHQGTKDHPPLTKEKDA